MPATPARSLLRPSPLLGAPILRSVWRLAWPGVVLVLFQSAVSIADTHYTMMGSTDPDSMVPSADGIARARGTEVQRVHLGALIGASVEETARNLTIALDDAQRSGAILLLDEADALFGTRTEVGDAHDRLAPTEADGIRDVLARHTGQIVVVPPDAP